MCFGKRKTPRHLIIENDYHRPAKWIGLGWLILAITVLLGSMLVSVAANANEALYESKSGQLLFQNSNGLYEASLHLKSHADVSINGMIAKVKLSQTFSNHTDDWQEGVYVFPLPENAAVNHMEMRIGDRVIIGEIKEKQIAKAIYQQAKRAGKRASLTEQNRPNIFTQRIANIGPQQEIEVSITYVQSIRYNEGEFSWRFPMTITPRYSPSGSSLRGSSYGQPETPPSSTSDLKKNSTFNEYENSSPARNPTISPDSGWASSKVLNSEDSNVDDWRVPSSIVSFAGLPPHNPMSMIISLDGGLPLENIAALFHNVHITKNNGLHTIRLAKGTVNMDRDFVLNWKPVQSEAPQAALFSEIINGDHYSLLMILPPQSQNKSMRLARDMVFIIDTSGSMAGASIAQAKVSLIQALSRLNEHDRFNIIEFNSRHSSLFNRLHHASLPNINQASAWVNGLSASGGTEMLPALNSAFKQFSGSESLQQTVFITDGSVSNEAELFKTIHKNIGNSRLFTVGIGSAPNSYFMKKAAEFGRGSFTYINDINRVSEKINSLFNKLDGAVAKNISVNWPGKAHIYPNNIPDLYLSEPLLISVKSSDLQGDVEIRGVTAQAPWQRNLSLNNHKRSEGVATLWARSKIEDLKISGGNRDVIKQEITAVALKHSLLSAYTSFVAVEQEVVRPLELQLTSSPIQNVLPAGHAAHKLKPIAYPSTATTAEISWWLGLFCAFVLIVTRRLNKD